MRRAVREPEEEFLGRILRAELAEDGEIREGEPFLETGAQGGGEVGHRLKGAGPPRVEPVQRLSRTVRGLPHGAECGFEFRERERLDGRMALRVHRRTISPIFGRCVSIFSTNAR